MAQPRRSGARPRFVTVVGLKRSGKTTVVEALIRELCSRGYSVGSVKSMRRHSAATLDARGTDTRRHARAGAGVVVALLERETVRFQQGPPPRTLAGIRRLFPARTRFIVSEGQFDPRGGQLVIVCLRADSELEEVLEVRRIRRSAVLAISGIAGGRSMRGEHRHAGDELPRFDVRRRDQRRELVDLILSAWHTRKKNSPPRCKKLKVL